MKRIPVKSGVLLNVGYHDAGARLDIELCSGRVYRYFDVSREACRQLLESASKRPRNGSYYHTRIKPDHGCEEIADR